MEEFEKKCTIYDEEINEITRYPYLANTMSYFHEFTQIIKNIDKEKPYLYMFYIFNLHDNTADHFFIIEIYNWIIYLYQSFQNRFTLQTITMTIKEFLQNLSDLISFNEIKAHNAIKTLFCQKYNNCEGIINNLSRHIDEGYVSFIVDRYSENKTYKKKMENLFGDIKFIPLSFRFIDLNNSNSVRGMYYNALINEDKESIKEKNDEKKTIENKKTNNNKNECSQISSGDKDKNTQYSNKNKKQPYLNNCSIFKRLR